MSSRMNRIQAVGILLGMLGFALVMLLDLGHWNVRLLAEGNPNFHRGHLVRSALILISMIALLLPAAIAHRGRLRPTAAGTALFERSCMVGNGLAALGFALLFLFRPALFNSLALEDHPIEWGSFALWILASLTFFASFIAGGKPGAPGFARWMMLAAALAAFVLGMEEVSWMQRVFDVKTPELLESNAQGEMNLHNLAGDNGTDLLENVYYFGSFVFLVIVPFIRATCPGLFERKWLKPLAPRPFIAVCGAFACAYNYDMWNVVFMQAALFGSLTVLAIFLFCGEPGPNRAILILAMLVMLASQAVFLTHGSLFGRPWDVTEYREFLIPLVFLTFAADCLRQARSPADRSAE